MCSSGNRIPYWIIYDFWKLDSTKGGLVCKKPDYIIVALKYFAPPPPLDIKRVYLPLCEVANTPFHIQGGQIIEVQKEPCITIFVLFQLENKYV